MTLHRWLSRRELGEGRCLGQTSLKSSLCQDIYSSFRCLRMWSPQNSVCHMHHGGIFNFDFSLDGSVLVAACERQSVLVFDPHNARLIGCQEKAHTDCVNYVRFLDSRMFATCSDDKTVRLWDLRFLKKDVMTLRGHSNWVKNIEYARGQGLLVTSGFDGSICTWDINKNRSSESVVCNPVFHTNGLMRSRLTPDGKKLIITTTEGYIIIIHDLDLWTLSQDLSGFKPSLYRVMQTRGFPLPQACQFNSLFTRKTNRVELISDFPPWNDAEMIASLDVHPQGWCIVSRNTGSDEDSEWTCVHDIQGSVDDVEIEDVFPDRRFLEPPVTPEEPENEVRDAEMVLDSSAHLAPPVSNVIDLENPAFQVSGFPRQGLSFTSASDSRDNSTDSEPPPSSDHVACTVRLQSGEEPIQRVLQPTVRETRRNWWMHKNKPRLMHYIEEPNVGRGFIKEICFSNDGRLVCSPFANGVRLLAFDSSCSELCDCFPMSPSKLHEVVTNINRGGIIVSNKFSPTDALLVTGCLEGKIGFHQPVW